jgi:uncharacterized membrane protein
MLGIKVICLAMFPGNMYMNQNMYNKKEC